MGKESGTSHLKLQDLSHVIALTLFRTTKITHQKGKLQLLLTVRVHGGELRVYGGELARLLLMVSHARAEGGSADVSDDGAGIDVAHKLRLPL
ncbi:RhaA is able to hydrolyze alpha-1 [Sesbania bispinosa]|nr:RhaA is able to hydrolyze alpha-1 [Sesbania bispinosa]